MIAAARPPTEQRRLKTLKALQVLDTPPDEMLEGMVRCAAHLLDCPVALVSLVDGDRQWFKARLGMTLSETPREMAFCAHAILGEDVFTVPDARADERFADNPLVTGELRVRAYAGVPIRLDGEALGTLCVMDHSPRQLTPLQLTLLRDLGAAVAGWFAHRREQLALQAERGRADEQLALLRRLSAQVPGVLFQYREDADGDCRFGHVSERAQELLGIDAAALQDDWRLFLGGVHEDDRAAVCETFEEAARDGQPWRAEFRLRPAAGGASAWRAVHATPSRLADGGLQWHGLVTDLSREREFDRLRRDKLAAERASAEKTAFLARVSHELRTPLNAMLGFTQLLLMDEQDALSTRQADRVQHAHRSARLLLGLINDVLDLSRIEQGAREFRIEPVDVAALLRSSASMLGQMARAAQVEIELVMPTLGRPALAHADARAFEQVLLNLMGNGIKYNRRGGRLAVRLSCTDTLLRVAVQDQGAGLAPEQVASLFQPFNRLGAETTPIEGSGLGLVISRQLAEAMGGQIEVRSDLGQGSTFSLVLPACDEHGEPPAEDAAPPATAAAGHAEVTVLYIEDDPLNALLVQEALRSRTTWHVLHAADGLSGLALARAVQPDVVLTDINLPGMSGIEIVRALRRDPMIRHTVCIALSANAMSPQVEEAMRAGFDEYWTKPLDVGALAGRIDAWLDRGDSRLADLDAAVASASASASASATR